MTGARTMTRRRGEDEEQDERWRLMGEGGGEIWATITAARATHDFMDFGSVTGRRPQKSCVQRRDEGSAPRTIGLPCTATESS